MSAFRIYEPSECGADGYPFEWHKTVKHLVREQAGHRCVRCGHPYQCGEHGSGEWSRCDERCTHVGPIRGAMVRGDETAGSLVRKAERYGIATTIEAQWRILTVHHLRLGRDAKRDLRWWNLAALCQRCHLQIQGKVQMERIWPWPHSEWFKPYAAGWYAHCYLGEDLTRTEVEARLDELLALELAA
jgi:hypothetical protein